MLCTRFTCSYLIADAMVPRDCFRKGHLLINAIEEPGYLRDDGTETSIRCCHLVRAVATSIFNCTWTGYGESGHQLLPSGVGSGVCTYNINFTGMLGPFYSVHAQLANNACT